MKDTPSKCRIAVQAICAGPQEVGVGGATPNAGPNGHGYISVRVGRTLVYVEDREALESFQQAWSRASSWPTRPSAP